MERMSYNAASKAAMAAALMSSLLTLDARLLLGMDAR